MDTSKEQKGTTHEEDLATRIESAKDRSGASSSNVLILSEKRDDDKSVQISNREGVPSLAGKTGGPKTQQGRQKSKRNALKHGIFSQVVLIKGEPRGEFDSLLSGLREELEPEGMLEELLVDKLAAIVWRQRRLIIAEGAEIRKGREFPKSEQTPRQTVGSGFFPFPFRDAASGGLMRRIGNSTVLETCLELLKDLKYSMENDGFDEEYDMAILTKLYKGYHPDDGSGTLLGSYSHWYSQSRAIGGEQDGLASSEECKNTFLQEIKEEITQLNHCKKQRALFERKQVLIQSKKMKVESLRANVPDAPQLDRLIRYETTLERGFDRILIQLDRQQRMRKGEPVPPTLNVNVSA